MTTPARRRRITVIASQAGVAIAEQSLSRLGFDNKSNFAKNQLMGKSTVDNFFNQKGIQLDSFKRICEGLKINWTDLLEQSSVVSQDDLKNPIALGQLESSVSSPYRAREPMQAASRQITIDDEKSQESKLVIVLEGDIDSINNTTQQTIETFLRNRLGGTIKITDIQPGSIRIAVQGDKKDIAKLVDRFTSGELTEVNGFAVEEIQILSQDFLEKADEVISLNKWELVREIATHSIINRQLSGEDLSDADLWDANLQAANLRDANLSYADLSHADLSHADLSGADLSYADLSDANLSYADLIGAKIDETTVIDEKWRLVWEIVTQRVRGRDLSGANLSYADLRGVNLHGVNFSGADLRSADLRSADLGDANLGDADLRSTNLGDASLIGASLIGASLDETTVIDEKWRLVWEIVNLGVGVMKRSLRSVNLRSADLHSADLRSANLRSADLRSADLRSANLRSADLRSADLRDANLISADLIGADLRGSNLRDANVANAQLGGALGLSEDEKRNLIERGAIFDETPGDRSSTFSPVHR